MQGQPAGSKGDTEGGHPGGGGDDSFAVLTEQDRLSIGGGRQDVGRRGIKEYRAPEALALIAADREHSPLVCPSCGTRSIQRVPRRRGGRASVILQSERITLTCQTCGRHAAYIERGPEPPRDSTMDPHPAASPNR